MTKEEKVEVMTMVGHFVGFLDKAIVRIKDEIEAREGEVRGDQTLTDLLAYRGLCLEAIDGFQREIADMVLAEEGEVWPDLIEVEVE